MFDAATSRNLKRGLNTLAVVTSIAPLAGFLCSCVRIIQALEFCRTGDSATCFRAIEEGTSEAMVRAALGLLVAAAAGLAYRYFRWLLRGTGPSAYLSDRFSLKDSFRLTSGMNYLAAIARTAPLLGFLGTTIETIGGMATIASGIHLTSQEISNGVLIALTPAAIGLMVGIPTLWGNCYLRNRAEDLDVEMRSKAAQLLNLYQTSTIR
jgi:biopolymer transport protein ExbB/TolQ